MAETLRSAQKRAAQHHIIRTIATQNSRLEMLGELNSSLPKCEIQECRFGRLKNGLGATNLGASTEALLSEPLADQRLVPDRGPCRTIHNLGRRLTTVED